MTAGIDSGASTVAFTVGAKTGPETEKLSFATSKARASVRVAEDENKNKNNNNNNIATMTSMTSLFASSTDTTIEDHQNETELLLMDLDNFPDIDDGNEDSCSVSSSTTTGSSVISRYFEPTDFLPWEDLFSSAEYAPHVGFAMVAGGFAFLHPFVFFAGVVTALGAYRAAGATYEYVTCRKQTHTKKVDINEGDDSTINNMMISCDWLPSVIGFNETDDDDDVDIDIDIDIDAITTKKAESAVSPAHSTVGAVDSVPALTKASSSCSTNASTIEGLSDDDVNANANNKTETPVVSGSSVPFGIQSPPKVHQQPKEENLDPVRWVKDNYPALPTIALDNVEFRGLNAHEFFDVFFADDAPFGFPAFHNLRRDKEVQYGSWNTAVPSEDTNSSDIPPSIIANERGVEYHAKTNSFLGPAYAPTKKRQRAYFVSKKVLVIEIKMTLHDIPFSKQFYLIERWVIDGTGTGTGIESNGSSSNTNNNSTNKNLNSRKQNKKQQQQNNKNSSKAHSSHCVYLTVSSKVYFTQECPFESAIVKESAKQICEISKCWNAMAQEGLKRTEETRTKRLRQKQQREEERRLQREQQELLSSSSPSSSLSLELVSAMNTSTNNNRNFETDESVEIEHMDDHVGDGYSNDRRGGRRSSTRSKRSSFSQNQHPPQPHRPLRNRSLSQSFSKLLVRGNSNATESSQKHFSSSPPKVRISSAGNPTC